MEDVLKKGALICTGCGGEDFERLGVQEGFVEGQKLKVKKIYLVNCLRCHTTLSCEEEFYLGLDRGCLKEVEK